VPPQNTVHDRIRSFLRLVRFTSYLAITDSSSIRSGTAREHKVGAAGDDGVYGCDAFSMEIRAGTFCNNSLSCFLTRALAAIAAAGCIWSPAAVAEPVISDTRARAQCEG
jgi:hypothetical protein